MNLLDRHIFKSVLITCLGAVGLFVFVLTLGNVMKELLGSLLAEQIDALLFVRLTLLLVVYAASFALPMGVLTGVLLTLGRLSADSEITAMRACGIGLTRIARPILLLGLLLSGLSLWVNQSVGPWARLTFKRELAEALRANPMSLLVPRTFIRQFPGMVLYVGERKGTELEDFWIWQLDRDQRATKLIRAQKGEITYREEQNLLVLTLRKAVVEVRDDRNPEATDKPAWVGSIEETEQFQLPLDKVFSKNVARTKLDYLPHTALMQKLQELGGTRVGEGTAEREQRERERMKVLLVLSERVNNALAVLAFTMIAIPLGIRVSRRETSANLGVAVALALLYFFCTTAISWLEKVPGSEPWILYFIPNAALMVIALILHERVDQR